MHSTRRRPDRSASRALAAVAFFATGGIAASCSNTESAPEPSVEDAGSEASPDVAPRDAAVDVVRRDAAWVDVSELPIVCNSPPCATSLVTTLGGGGGDLGEGFCALLSDKTVACWGANGAGQLGRGDDGGTIDSSVAARVAGLANIVALDHTCAIDGDGAAWCWGTGPFLRDGTGASSTERTPVKLPLPAVTKIGVGYGTGCAVIAGGVQCWGSNADGQLGTPTKGDQGGPRSLPIPAGAPIRDLTVGRATFVLREDGSLVTWGANPPIGRVSPIFPDPNPQTIPLGKLFMVDLADDNACATAGGTGYCWGAPVVEPRPGDGTVTERGEPRPIVTTEPIVQIATTRNYVIENAGLQHYRWCASTVSGAVYCWGYNESGQAGDGTQKYALEPVRVAGLPAPVAQLKTTPTTTCALLTNGKIHCWGSNYYGQLGNGQTKGRSLVPVEVVLP